MTYFSNFRNGLRLILIALVVTTMSGCGAMVRSGIKSQYEGLESKTFKTAVLYAEDSDRGAAVRAAQRAKQNLVTRNLIQPDSNVVITGIGPTAMGHGLRWVLVTPPDLVLKTGDVVLSTRPSTDTTANIDTVLDIKEANQIGQLEAIVCRATDKDCVKKNEDYGVVLDDGTTTTGKNCFFACF